jgi:hypothetical protein
MTLYLQTSDRRSIVISTVETAEEATQVVKDLDGQFEEWEKLGFPEHPFPPVLKNWEGGDVYLNGDGHTWMFTDFGWQEFCDGSV